MKHKLPPIKGTQYKNENTDLIITFVRSEKKGRGRVILFFRREDDHETITQTQEQFRKGLALGVFEEVKL